MRPRRGDSATVAGGHALGPGGVARSRRDGRSVKEGKTTDVHDVADQVI